MEPVSEQKSKTITSCFMCAQENYITIGYACRIRAVNKFVPTDFLCDEADFAFSYKRKLKTTVRYSNNFAAPPVRLHFVIRYSLQVSSHKISVRLKNQLKVTQLDKKCLIASFSFVRENIGNIIYKIFLLQL